MNMGVDQDAKTKKGAETKKSSVKKLTDAKRSAAREDLKETSKLIRSDTET